MSVCSSAEPQSVDRESNQEKITTQCAHQDLDRGSGAGMVWRGKEVVVHKGGARKRRNRPDVHKGK